MKIYNYFSPNFDRKNRSINSIKLIIIHYTGMQSERESLLRLCNPKSKVSSHFLISQKGKIYRLVKEENIAWHAGKSCWGNFKNINQRSIGIELVNKGHEFGYRNFKKKQISSLIKLCRGLKKKYKINKKNIIGHSDIAPTRKMDPGEKFPWKRLSAKGLGMWHYCKPRLLKKNRKKFNFKKNEKVKFIKNLSKIGYCTSKQSFFKNYLIAFQRHYRKELVNGYLDKECLIIAQNLKENL